MSQLFPQQAVLSEWEAKLLRSLPEEKIFIDAMNATGAAVVLAKTEVVDNELELLKNSVDEEVGSST